MIKKLSLAITAVIVLNACTSSGIQYQPNSLTLQVEENQVMLDATLLQKKREYFRTLVIEQKILKLKAGNLLVYEDANTDISYEFSPATTHIIRSVFDARAILKVYARSNMYAFQVTIANGQILNVLAQQDESQRLRFGYGMSTKQFNSMLKQLDKTATLAPYTNVLTLHDDKHAMLSRWTTMKVDFLPLVKPVSTRLIW
jgi:hypothetical protein